MSDTEAIITLLLLLFSTLGLLIAWVSRPNYLEVENQ